MKLLYVIPEYPPLTGGGIATFYIHQLQELASQGHQVHAIVGSSLSSQSSDYQKDGLIVESLDIQAVNTNLAKFDRYHAVPEFQRHLAAAWTAWEQANGGREFDLVETTDWGMLFAPWIVSAESPPTVVQCHASIGQIDFYDPQFDAQLQGTLVRLLEVGLLSVADELQTYSQLNAQAWRQLTQRDITYIPPALLALQESPPLIKTSNGLVVGRIQYWKGPTVLSEALRLLGSKAPDVDWIGRDTVYQDAHSSMAGYLAQTYPDVWGTKIHPLGAFSAQETRQRQANAAFMVVPSLWDVFNYTCAEGMAQAQTVLCSEGAGAVDLIADGVNGLTFAANNPEALAESLDKLLSMSSADRAEMGKAAQQTIQTQLSPTKIAQQRLEAYEKLIQRGKHPVRPNSWLVEAVSPGASLEKPLAFLDRLPLRELSHYIVKRSFKKFMH